MEEKVSETEFVAYTVEKWLGNRVSRALLKSTLKRDENGESNLEKALRKYSGEKVKVGWFTFLVVKKAVEKGAESLGISKEKIKNSLKAPIVRRGLVNILEGIAYFGVKRPQITAAPFLIVWDITYGCNLKCKHCYASAGKKAPDELTTLEAKRAIDLFRKIGVVAIAFSGGEPLTREDIFDLIKYAKENDFYVSMASNGTLITPEVARELKERGLDYIEISLDGFEKTHDSFRGIKGAWKKTVKGIKNCVAAGLDTCVATTATYYNLKEIPKLINFVEKELKANRFILFNFVPTRRGKEIAIEDLDPKEREELLDLLYSKLIDQNCPLDTFSTAPQYAVTAAEYPTGPAVATHFTNKTALEMLKGKTKALTEFIGGCGAGRLYCGMEPNGDLQPCVFIPIKIGNIKEDNFLEIWRNSPILKEIRERKNFIGCGDCEYKYICGGCRARAYGYFRDLKGPDPGCTFNQKYWEEIKNSAQKALFF